MPTFAYIGEQKDDYHKNNYIKLTSKTYEASLQTLSPGHSEHLVCPVMLLVVVPYAHLRGATVGFGHM